MNEVESTTYQSIGGKKMEKPDEKAKLGEGGRFAALKSKLAKKKDIGDAGVVVAKIGQEKYGKGKMEKMAIKGRMDKENC